MSLILSGNSGSMTVDSTAGVTFPAGGNPQAAPSKVLQVVNAAYATSVSTTNGSASPVATGLTATITPLFSTSKILIFISHPQNAKGAGNTGTDIAFKLYKNGSNLVQFSTDLGYINSANANYFSASFVYLDSPATTSATTYATYFANGNSTGDTVYVNSGSTSTITLMEIAQ